MAVTIFVVEALLPGARRARQVFEDRSEAEAYADQLSVQYGSRHVHLWELTEKGAPHG